MLLCATELCRAAEGSVMCCCALQNCVAEYIQQDAFHNLFISIRRPTYFGRFFRPSSGAQKCTYSVRYWSAAASLASGR